MKILQTVKSGLQAAKKFLVEQKDKALAALGLALVGGSPTASKAAIVVDPATGVMSGTMDLSPFFGATVIAATAIGTMLAVFLGIKALKKVA